MKTSKKPTKAKNTERVTIRVAKISGHYKIIAAVIGAALPVFLAYLLLQKSDNLNGNDTFSIQNSHVDSKITEIPNDGFNSNHKSLSYNTQNKLVDHPSVDSLNNRKDNVTHSNNAEQRYDTDSKKVFYDVTLIIPSFMSDAKIFVDEKPAIVINRSPTIVKIRVEKKESNHQIKLIRDNYPPCIIEQFIRENNLVLTPCQ